VKEWSGLISEKGLFSAGFPTLMDPRALELQTFLDGRWMDRARLCPEVLAAQHLYNP